MPSQCAERGQKTTHQQCSGIPGLARKCPGEEQKLNDPDYRRRLAGAIVGGVRGYFTRQPPPGTWFAARMDEPAPVSMLASSHVVGRGETLSLIAQRHGVGVDTLRRANNLRDDRVRVGERLTIPATIMASNPE